MCDGLGSSFAALISVMHQSVLGSSGIVPAALVAIFLNMILPKEKEA